MIASRGAARALQFKYPTSKAYPNISNKTGPLARVRLQARGTATDTDTQNPGRPAARPNPVRPLHLPWCTPREAPVRMYSSRPRVTRGAIP